MQFDKGLELTTDIKIIRVGGLFGKGNRPQLQSYGDNLFVVGGQTSFIREVETTIAFTGCSKKATRGYHAAVVVDAPTKLREKEFIHLDDGVNDIIVQIQEISGNNIKFSSIDGFVELEETGNFVSLRDTVLRENDVTNQIPLDVKYITVKSAGTTSLELTSFLKKNI